MTATGRVKVVAAGAADHLVIEDGGTFYARTPYGPDTPLRVGGCTPAQARAALMTKWGFDPVVGKDGKPEPEIGAGEAALVEQTKLPDGSAAWRMTGTAPHDPAGPKPPR